MKNKNKTKPAKSNKESASQAMTPPLAGQKNGMCGEPSATVKTWLSIWVTVHLLAITVSFTAVVEPSSLHQRLSDVLQPYLRPSHFSADDRPVYLTHGDVDDLPHRIEVTTGRVTGLATAEGLNWQAVGPAEGRGLSSTPGLAVSDRVARWLSTAAMLAENDQPSLVADLLLPVVIEDRSIQGVRIVRYPTDLSDINEDVTVPYLARVVRDKGKVSLVQLKDSRLSAQPRLSAIRVRPMEAHASEEWLDETRVSPVEPLAANEPLAAHHDLRHHMNGVEAMQ